jgi:hypothetical protein
LNPVPDVLWLETLVFFTSFTGVAELFKNTASGTKTFSIRLFSKFSIDEFYYLF